MTTPVNTFQDILDALEQNPALRDQLRNYILTEELLQLPAQFVLLRADVDELKSGQARLEEGQACLQAGQVRLEARMDRLEGRFGNVEGHQYEQRAASRILVRATLLNIETPQIALAQAGQVRQDFHDAMAVAVRAGLISQDEYYDLADTDLIVRGGNRRHAVVEISLGPDEDDISRAIRRSEILQRSTGEHVTPVVAAPSPHPALVLEAERRNALVLDIPA